MTIALFNELYHEVTDEVAETAKKIQLVICDVDGVFSDGLVYMGNDGEELKAFHTHDGYGIKAILAAGLQVAVITGRQSKIVTQRMQALGISMVYQGQDNKLSAYQDILKQTGITPAHIAYIGDDLIDWPVMQEVALQVCVANGHPLLIKRANYITQRSGGQGAVREVCDLILSAQNRLEQFTGKSI